ncbi:MAG: hypothetical protein J6U54_04355 [Clostridiales bacterium]|nr:hypothetical protein [Clostridiales bacterium]
MKMHNGCILCGGVGSGKTRTALVYYHCMIGGGRVKPRFTPMAHPVDLYVITTAATRDKFGWEREMVHFLLYDNMSKKAGVGESKPLYKTKVIVDSWNNIQKYVGVSGAFFIFDEQRVTGTGPWVKAFLKITKVNNWILLSATPGDKWTDYAPVFIANGFYKNITEFRDMHVIYKKQGTFWKPSGYFNTRRLERLRDAILVDLPVEKDTIRHNIDIPCEYDKSKYRSIMRTRWDPFNEKQIDTAPALCQCRRKVVNSDPSRLNVFLDILHEHPKVIVFYNYDYERDMLMDILDKSSIKYSEWNGHHHQDIPSGPKWVYLVHYLACEGWNCILTDTVIFFSQNYSYKIMEQASGRIDRRNTPFIDLYYYHLKSKAPIDLAITRAITEKKIFNEGRYFNRMYKEKTNG